VFVLLGPRNENIDYLEIGRCMGTLMTNKVSIRLYNFVSKCVKVSVGTRFLSSVWKDFHDCAYRVNDRRELIEGITSFINRSLCLVVPAGEFDYDLMLPIIEWMRAKIKSKMGKQNSETKLYDKCLTPTSSKYKSKLLGSMIAGIGGVAGGVSMAGVGASAAGGDRLDPHGKPKFSMTSGLVGYSDPNGSSMPHGKSQRYYAYNHERDPFQKTGRLFGNLISELKYRYAFYWSDFKDGLNIHCFIAFVFIFTVCIATALSFGGILGNVLSEMIIQLSCLITLSLFLLKISADKTNKWFGVNEMLIATSMNGIIAGLFSAQPLMIHGPTGPFLVFEGKTNTFLIIRPCLIY
jgi:hypothetical protein